MDNKSAFDIRLSNNRNTPWVETATGKVKGYAFLDNRLLTAEELTAYCSDAIDKNEHRLRLARLNGCYSVVMKKEEDVWLISDRTRSCPLFFYKAGGVWHITDVGDEALKHKPLKSFVHLNVLQFLACGYLAAGDTLVEDVQIALPGSAMLLSPKKEHVVWESYVDDFRLRTQRTEEELFNQSTEAFEHAFQRSLQIVGNRTILLPLSGGYDSRLIACLCRKYNCDKVVCYSYGIEGSEEVEVSRQVAERLGYPWYTVECTAEKWEKLMRTDLFRKYIRYGGNLSAIAHIQDLLALHELTERGVIPPDSVFIPGHSGDMLGGSHFPLHIHKSEVADVLYNKYFCLNLLKGKYRRFVKKMLCSLLYNSFPMKNEEECYESLYQWNYNARQVGFIINSVRAYEYFGHSWLLPMWDNEFEELWNSVPAKERVGSALYVEWAFSRYFEPMGVAYRKREGSSLPTVKQRLVGLFLSKDNRYRIKYLLAKAGIYRFPKDNAALDEAAKILNGLFTLDLLQLSLQKEEIMSVKTRYYLYLLIQARALG